MLLCNLPEDILAIVLGRCVLASYNMSDDLKRNLPLLAVCRQWRRLAVPLVYNQVFAQYGDWRDWNMGLSRRDPNVKEPTGVAVKTNLDLVAMNECARAVKRVQIDVHSLANPFPGWREVIQRMHAAADKWRVAELKVEMHPSHRHFVDHIVDMAEYTDDVAEVSDALAVLMPDVRRLDCGGATQNTIARSLYGRLAGHYADQLQWLTGEKPITVPLDCQLTRLKKLSIAVDSVSDHRLPQIMSDELVDMSLVNGPSNHSWESFSADSDSRVIEFTKLKRLSAVYHEIYRESGVAVRHLDGHPWKLHFPILKRLHIRCSQDICPLLEFAVLPPRMESISIDMNSAAFQDIADLVLPETEYLSLGIFQGSGGDPSGLPIVSRILERARGSEILELNIGDERLPVVPESITCTALTHLTVAAPISVDTMLALFARLPGLIHMSLFDLDLSVVEADLSVPCADDDAVVEPLHASLRALAINCNMRRQSPDMEVAAAVVKYLLLGIPTLTRLLAGQTPKDTVLSFVEEYAPHYPHLRGVQLRLN